MSDLDIDYRNDIASPRTILDKTREEIKTSAGDSESLIGTATDGVQLLLLAFSQLTVSLHKAQSVAEVRAAAEPYHELASNFLSKVESGEVKLPFQEKGLDNVIIDIENRATAVSNVIAQNKQPQQPE